MGWFYANQSQITKEHCINKFRPSMKCNGKCYLAKKMKEAEDHQQNDRAKVENPLLELAPTANENQAPELKLVHFNKTYPKYTSNVYCFLYIKDLLRPPRLA